MEQHARPDNHYSGEYDPDMNDGLAGEPEPLHEWACPQCGATTRARMADAPALSAAMLAIVDFHGAMGQPFGGGGIEESELRIRLHREETQELVEALEAEDLAAAARELADVVYVAYGTAYSLGIPLDLVFAEVHRANMSKIGPTGPLFREDGKVLKPDGFIPPDVERVLRDAGVIE